MTPNASAGAGEIPAGHSGGILGCWGGDGFVPPAPAATGTPGAAEGPAGPAAHRDRGLLARRMLENTLKRSKCGRRQAPRGPGRRDRGRGSTRPAPGSAPAPAVPAVTQDGQSGASAGEPEKRGRDPQRLHRLPWPLPLPLPAAAGPGGRGRTGGTAGAEACGDGRGRGTPRRSRGDGARPPRFGTFPTRGLPRRCPRRGSRHRRCPGAYLAGGARARWRPHIWAALGAGSAGKCGGLCLQGRAGGRFIPC